jgi:SpoVK/Ycf46/Vps4 family AAA+-type ATPase
MKVEDALRIALGDTELSLKVHGPSLQGMTQEDVSALLRAAITEPLQTALQAQQERHEAELRAVQDAAEHSSQAVLEELRRVRAEFEKLNKESAPSSALPAADTAPRDDAANTRHGLLVRLALWFEGRFRG